MISDSVVKRYPLVAENMAVIFPGGNAYCCQKVFQRAQEFYCLKNCIRACLGCHFSKHSDKYHSCLDREKTPEFQAVIPIVIDTLKKEGNLMDWYRIQDVS